MTGSRMAPARGHGRVIGRRTSPRRSRWPARGPRTRGPAPHGWRGGRWPRGRVARRGTVPARAARSAAAEVRSGPSRTSATDSIASSVSSVARASTRARWRAAPIVRGSATGGGADGTTDRGVTLGPRSGDQRSTGAGHRELALARGRRRRRLRRGGSPADEAGGDDDRRQHRALGRTRSAARGWQRRSPRTGRSGPRQQSSTIAPWWSSRGILAFDAAGNATAISLAEHRAHNPLRRRLPRRRRVAKVDRAADRTHRASRRPRRLLRRPRPTIALAWRRYAGIAVTAPARTSQRRARLPAGRHPFRQGAVTDNAGNSASKRGAIVVA